MCLAHGFHNGCGKMRSPMLNRFLSIFGKVFKNSENAIVVYEEVFGKRPRVGGATRFCSTMVAARPYSNLENLQKLGRVAAKCVDKNYSPTNAPALSMMLNDVDSCAFRLLQGELLMGNEALGKAVDCTYNNEGNDPDLVFTIAKDLDEVISQHPGGIVNINSMPKVVAYINETVTWAQTATATEGARKATAAAAAIVRVPSSVTELRSNARGRHPRSTQNQNPAALTAKQLEAKRAREAALEAQRQLAIEETQAKLEAEEAVQAAKAMPVTYDGLRDYLVNCVQPAVTYIHEHLTQGDRAPLLILVQSARLFDPSYAGALTMSLDYGRELIRNLCVYKALDEDILTGLHIELPSYLSACRTAMQNGLRETPKDILNWHFTFSGEFGLEKVAGRVSDLHKRPYEELRKPTKSGLNDGFRPSFYDAAELLVLIMPTSAIVERIFSMYDSRFGKRASRSMGDRILLELMLAFHKSPL